MYIFGLNVLQALKVSNYDSEPLLRSCGISISSNFTQVEGRVLQAPKVCFSYLVLIRLIFLCHYS